MRVLVVVIMLTFTSGWRGCHLLTAVRHHAISLLDISLIGNFADA
jgi:hypothetical protein